jgi:Na+/melibiose symporter-like transporter
MRINLGLWSLVSLGATLGAGTIAFFVGQDEWMAVLVGTFAGGTTSALQVPRNGAVRWDAAVCWTGATALATVLGIASYSASGQIWVAVVVALVAAGVVGALQSVVGWLVSPTPIDLDVMLGELA